MRIRAIMTVAKLYAFGDRSADVVMTTGLWPSAHAPQSRSFGQAPMGPCNRWSAGWRSCLSGHSALTALGCHSGSIDLSARGWYGPPPVPTCNQYCAVAQKSCRVQVATNGHVGAGDEPPKHGEIEECLGCAVAPRHLAPG